MYTATTGVNLAALAPGSRLLSEGFRTLFFDELAEAKPTFDKIFDVRTTIKRAESDFEFVGLTMAVQSTIGGPTEYESPFDGNAKQTVIMNFKKGFQIAEEDEEDDLYGVLGKVGKSLPKCFTRRVESLCAGVFAGMFSTTTGFDGLPLASTAHPFPPGRSNATTGATTWANRPAVDAALSPEGLQTLMTLLRQTRTREGMPAGLKGDLLVVSVENETRAWEIVKSMYKPYTDTNERNVWSDNGGLYPIKVLSWEWLPSQTMYALLDSDHSPFFWYWRQRPQFREMTDINNGIRQFYGRMRGVGDGNEPRGLAATPGA